MNKFLKVSLTVLVVFAGLIMVRKIVGIPDPYPRPASIANIPTFKEIPIEFTHHYDKKHSLPFMGAAIFDMKGDGTNYLFVGGGYNQADQLFVFRDGAFVNVTEGSGLSKDPNDTTYGVAAIDVNQDGVADLFIARESGVYLYENNNGVFSGKKLDIPLDEKSAPLSIAVADLQKNGLVDLFICAYVKKPYVEGQSIFNKEGYGGKSLLLKNNGDNTFTNITAEAGLDYTHNTFQAAFVDLDGDGELDLVVVHDTGQVRTYKNMGNLTFKNMPNPTSNVYSYPMGLAIGDFMQEGRPSLFFSNIGPFHFSNLGSTPPTMMVRGDLKPDQKLHRENILLRNKGNFQFEDVAQQAKVANYEFGWGAVAQDFNNDGRVDIVFSQNYVGFPLHKLFKLPGRLLQQLPDQTFITVEKEAGIVNPYYSISPLTADLTGNGYTDLMFINLDGPLRVFLNQGGENHFLKVVLPNEPSSIGAVVTVETESGKTLTNFFVPTQGLCSYQTNTLHFGLADETALKKVTVRFMDGRVKMYDKVEINTSLYLK